MTNWQNLKTPFGASVRIAFLSEDSVCLQIRREDEPLIINKIPCYGTVYFRLGSAGGVSFNDDSKWRIDTANVYFRRKTDNFSDNDSLTDSMNAKLWAWFRSDAIKWIYNNKDSVLPIEATLTNLQKEAFDLDTKIEKMLEESKQLNVSILSVTKRLKKVRGR